MRGGDVSNSHTEVRGDDPYSSAGQGVKVKVIFDFVAQGSICVLQTPLLPKNISY